ncbi:MAG TPA: hypothetical protein VN622_05535, partial [Clostridia bacterium]|nr:hypothetical protein [Clostridia bacterium]
MNRQVRDNTLVASESTAQMRLTIRLRLMRRVALVLLLLCAATVRAADSLTVAVSIAPATMIANGATSDITPMSVRTAWNTPGTKNYTVTSCIYMTGALTPAIAANTDSIPYTDVRA